MVTENNSQINGFSNGMDSDTSIDNVNQNSYLYAKNLRIVHQDDQSRNGSIIPIDGITLAGQVIGNVDRILAAGTIRKYGIIVYIDHVGDYELCVARFENKIGGGVDLSKKFDLVDPEVIFKSKLIDWPEDTNKWPKAVSISFKYEAENNIKLYIATKFNPILVLNITKNYTDYTIDDVSSYPKVQFSKPIFKKYITGALKPGLASYSYQLYNDYGTATDISPACQQIPVVNIDKNDSDDIMKIYGEIYGKNTSCGIQIQIPKFDQSKFDKIRIYRILVQQNGQIPTIEIIYDSFLSKNPNDFTFNDVGQDAIDQISIEEYNSMSGIHIIPNSIENKDQLLFAANVTEKQTFIKDDDFINWEARAFQRNSSGNITLQNIDTQECQSFSDYTSITSQQDKIYRDSFNPYNDINKQFADYDTKKCQFDNDGYYGGSGPNVSWRFVLTYIPIDTCEVDEKALKIGTLYNILKCESIDEKPRCHFIHRIRGLEDMDSSVSDESGRIEESWLTKSLRRNELYRYGIILYDKTGNPSPVKWIADIRTPNLYDKYFNTFISHYRTKNGKIYDLASLPLGISFNVKNLPKDCTGYEIVRCTRREQDIASISQGVISKPIVNYITPASPRVKSQLYFPTGLLTTAMVAQGTDFNYFKENYNPGTSIEQLARLVATNYANTTVLQFVSPEVVYQPESMKSIFRKKDYKLEPLRYLFGSSASLIDGQYKYTQRQDGDVTRYFMRPAISNCNLFTMPDNNRNKYFYCKSSLGGRVYWNKFWSDPYTLKIETQVATSIYYKAIPFLNRVSGNDYLFDAMLQYIYPDSNKWSYIAPGRFSNPIYSDNKRHIDIKAFSCIKLYEQGDTLLSVSQDSKDKFIQNELTYCNDGILQQSKPIIEDLQIASDLQWNEVIKMTYEGKGTNSNTENSGKWWPQLEYQKHIDSIGQYQFCNAVIYGTDGAQVDKGGNLGDDEWTIAHDMVDGANDGDMSVGYDYPTLRSKGHSLCFPFSTGGRCALLQLDDRNSNDNRPILATVLGAKSYFKNNENNILEPTSEYSTYKGGVNIESIAGTSLCNIRKEVTPYNGFSREAISSCVYYSTGQYFTKSNEWNNVFDGDVVISVLDYTSMHKAVCNFLKDNDASKYKDIADYRSHSVMLQYLIPVESPINCRLSSGQEFSKKSTTDDFSFVQKEPANIDGLYSQTEPEYVYNTAYSSEDKTDVHSAFDTENIDQFNQTVDYRCRNSNLKENNQHIDQWTKFQSSNYIDVDTQYGPITNLSAFKQSLLFWQQKAFGSLSVNERAVATDQNDQSIILGTGGILSRYDYIDTTSGMHEQQFCDTQSDSTLYWFDHHNNELKCYNGQMISLSKKFNVQTLLNDELEVKLAPKLLYDANNNEVVSKVLSEGNSLVFNENINRFTSTYSIPFDESLSFPNGVYLAKVNDGFIHIAQWDYSNTGYTQTWREKIEPSVLRYVVNKNPMITKVFDNQEFVTPQDECDIQNLNYNDNDSYFSINHNYTWQTESQKSKSSLADSITLREHNYRYSIPRANNSEMYGDRMRGKYMICTMLGNKPNTNVALQYILTKFRASWI